LARDVRRANRLTLFAAFGDRAIYLMINPTKASYSVAPTMMVYVLAGYLTANLFMEPSRVGPVGADRSADAGAFLLARSKDTFLHGT
jgi:hypothetical protein